MPRLKYWISRLSALWRADRIHDEIAEEMRFHMDQRAADNIRRGMSPKEARKEANLRFGHLTQLRERGYALRGGGWLESLFHDIRYGARTLRKNPAFTTAAVLTLALGIGANTAIFQLVNAVRFQPLPISNPQELVDIGFDHQGWYAGHMDGRYPVLTNALWEEIRTQQQALSGVFAWGTDTFNLARGGEAHYAQGLWISGDFFAVLGVQPQIGRLVSRADDRKGCGSGSAVISYGFWQKQFNGGLSALGSTLWLNGHPVEVIGVTPANFYGVEVGRQFDIAVPLCFEPILKGEHSNLNVRNAWWLAAMGRLKSGWSVKQASAHFAGISSGIFEATMPPVYQADLAEHYRAIKLRVVPAATGISALREEYESPLQLLLAATGLVLLIACANLANLLLARMSARKREMAVRLALGASRARLVRQILAENILLVLVGASVAVLLAQWLSRFLVGFLRTQDNPVFLDLRPGGIVLGFTSLVAGLTCVLFGLVPAWRGARTEPGVAMQSDGRSLTEGRERLGLRRVLVISEVALCLSLLVGALLFAHSLSNLLTMDTGFRQAGILRVDLDLTALQLPPERRQILKADLAAKISALPGLDSAAETLPLTWGDFNNNYIVPGDSSDPKSGFMSNLHWVAPRYFNTLEIPLLAGRDFGEHDTASSSRVAIVNEAFARRLSQEPNPVGRTFRMKAFADQSPVSYEIIGLVRNTKYQDLREDFSSIVFFPRSQEQEPDSYSEMIVRSRLPLADLLPSIKDRVASADPAIGVQFRVFKTELRESLLRERLMALLSSFFAVLAALLATIGVYGVMSYSVIRRTNEIGIRMALGAEPRHILLMVMREGSILLGVGLVLGSILALFTSHMSRAILFGLKPHDPLTFVLASLLLAVVATIASFLPARRASKVDPLVALRWQ